MRKLVRFSPLVLMVLILYSLYHFKLFQYMSFDALKEHRVFLMQWASDHYFQAVLIYMLIYIVAVAVSVPGATILTVSGGFLFGIIPGTLYAVISATIGAGLVFLAVHTAFGTRLIEKAGGWAQKMEKGFEKNAFNYLLALRLIPIVPFWAINIVSPILKVRLRVFMAATFLGIVPGSLVYVMVGSGLGSIFATDAAFGLKAVLTPSLIIALLGLAALSLLPVVYKRFK